MSKILSVLSLLLFIGFSAFAQTDSVSKTTDTSSDPVFLSVEQMPEFPGGEAAMLNYIQRNLHYPENARKEHITGTVPLAFVIDTSGRVKDVRVLRDIGGGCGEEAKRVIESMPLWKAGSQNGRPVFVHQSVSVKFLNPSRKK